MFQLRSVSVVATAGDEYMCTGIHSIRHTTLIELIAIDLDKGGLSHIKQYSN